MAITNAPLSDISKVNPTDVRQEQLADLQDTLEGQIKALEMRYKDPNWFKVSAGFLKPQLGGFGASLGSAFDAMGENVEKQREAELPLAQMRTQLAQTNILVGQNKTQSEEFEAWRASGKPMDATTYSRIVSLNPDSQVAKAAEKFYEGAKSAIDIRRDIVTAEGKDPLMNLHSALFSSQGKTPDQLAQIQKQIDETRPPQIEPQIWATMPRYAKMEAQESYAKAQSEIGLSEEEKSRNQAKSAYDRLPLLRNIREIALGAGIPETKDATGKTVSGAEQMAGLLNYFGGNSPIDVVARAAADGKFGDLLAGIDTYARQSGMSPEARDSFQKLVKLLAENQVSLRGSTLNPTDAFTSMQSMSSPNIGNSQKALVTLVDLIGHSEKHAQERHNYMVNSGVPARQLQLDSKFKQLETEYANTHRNIATSDPTRAAPSWYNPSSPMTTPSARPASAPATSSAPPATGGGSTLDRARAIQAERQRNRQP